MDVNGPVKMIDKETLISKIEYIIDNVLTIDQLEDIHRTPYVLFKSNGVLCEISMTRFFLLV